MLLEISPLWVLENPALKRYKGDFQGTHHISVFCWVFRPQGFAHKRRGECLACQVNPDGTSTLGLPGFHELPLDTYFFGSTWKPGGSSLNPRPRVRRVSSTALWLWGGWALRLVDFGLQQIQHFLVAPRSHGLIEQGLGYRGSVSSLLFLDLSSCKGSR